MSQNPLVSFGDLGKPVNTLIERVSDAVGRLTRPWQIRRVAGAEAEAAVIRAESEIRVTELHRDAFLRFLEEEAFKQAIMENVLLKAIPHVDPDNAKPEDVTGDWFANFFDKCRIVSDEDMQHLWARILAGEANNPGSFSRQTVNRMADLDKHDAELFGNICRFAWDQEGHPLVFDARQEVYNRQGIDFDAVSQLESLRLIHVNLLTSFVLEYHSKEVILSYRGRPITLTLPDGGENRLDVGKVMFTRAGQELSRICEVSPVEGFFEYVYDYWASQSLVPPREAQQDY